MENESESKPKQKGGPRANVRFSEREYGQLLKDEKERGISIPVLLRDAYFSGRPTAILMAKEETRAVLTELLRQGNNLNQLTRQVNAGIAANVKQELANIGRALTGMTALLRGKVLKLKEAE
ncbi:hypothetical protein WDW37_07380 [Bdellovibrionota bacterium FG-1]